jgi:hypothetical protein
MKEYLFASLIADSEKECLHSARLGRRSSALFWVAALLALAFPVALAAQTNTNAPIILVQPQSQSVWGGTSVTFSVVVTGGGGGASANLPAIGSGSLQLWLRADLGIVVTSNGQVSQWQDQSGIGNNAVQTNTNAQPLLVYPSAIGVLPSVRFSGLQNSSQSEFLHGSDTVAVPNAFTSFMLYEMNSGASNEPLRVPACRASRRKAASSFTVG